MTTQRTKPTGYEGSIFIDGVTNDDWLGDVTEFTPPQRSVSTGSFATRQRAGRLMRAQQYKSTVEPGAGSITVVADSESRAQALLYAGHLRNRQHTIYEQYAVGDEMYQYQWLSEITGWNRQTPSDGIVTIEIPFQDVGNIGPEIVPRLPTQTVSLAGSAVPFDLEPYIAALSAVTLAAVVDENHVETTGIISGATTVNINNVSSGVVAGDTDLITVTITDADNETATTEIPVVFIA